MKNHVILMITALLLGYTNTFAQLVPAPTDKQMQDLEKLMAPNRKKVTDALNADKSGQYKIYLADLEALAKSEDPEKRKALAEKLTRDHYTFIKKAYNSVVVNHEEMRRSVTRILGHNNFQMNEFGGISSSSFLPLDPIPLRFDETLACPFEVTEEETNHVLLSFCTSDVTGCNINVESTSMYDGGCRSKGSLGGKFELPEGAYQKITVTAQSNLSYDGIAMAFVGYAQANTKIGVRLQGPGYNQTVILQHHWCVAPIIWFTKFEGATQNTQLQAVFSGNFQGGNTFAAQAYNETFAFAVPLLQAANTQCRSSVSTVRVLAVN